MVYESRDRGQLLQCDATITVSCSLQPRNLGLLETQAIRDVDEKFKLASARSTNTTALAALTVSDKRRPKRRSDFADAQRAGLYAVVQALGITPARARVRR